VWRIGRGRASDARIRARLGYEAAEAVAVAPECLLRSSMRGVCIKRGGGRGKEFAFGFDGFKAEKQNAKWKVSL
jgi:hypothetical protein